MSQSKEDIDIGNFENPAALDIDIGNVEEKNGGRVSSRRMGTTG